MNLHCPICHAQFTIEALTQDAAARELLAMRAAMLPSLFSYLGLFRSPTRALAFDRALKLAHDVIKLDEDPARIEAALAETVETMRQKREQGQVKPLKNHNYLKRVLENQIPPSPPLAKGGVFGVGDNHNPTLGKGGGSAGGISRRASALVSLTDWAGDDWLRIEISAGLQALVAQSLKFQPGADIIAKNADVWFLTLRNICTIEQIDVLRLRSGFERLFSRVQEWPAPKQLLELMPARPPRQSLPEPEPSEEDRKRSLAALDQLKTRMGIK